MPVQNALGIVATGVSLGIGIKTADIGLRSLEKFAKVKKRKGKKLKLIYK
jgi:hypothetical protein